LSDTLPVQMVYHTASHCTTTTTAAAIVTTTINANTLRQADTVSE